MKLLQRRTTPTHNSTIGEFFVNGVHQAYGLEPVDRGLTQDMTFNQVRAIKIDGHTAQPTGTFHMDWYKSPDHGIYLPRVLGVMGFEDDEIHIGNFPKDTKACLLLGTGFGADEVYNSKVAITAFYDVFLKAWNDKEQIFITYERTYTLPIQYK